jgi:hypothetical protein
VFVKCHGITSYPKVSSPQALTVLSKFDAEGTSSFFPCADYFLRVVVNRGKVEELIKFMKAANKAIQPPMYHSYLLEGVTVFLAERKNYFESFDNKKQATYAVFDGLRLFYDTQVIKEKIERNGALVKDLFWAQDPTTWTTQDPESLLVAELDIPGGVLPPDNVWNIDNCPVAVKFCKDVDHLVPIHHAEPKQGAELTFHQHPNRESPLLVAFASLSDGSPYECRHGSQTQ